MIVEKTLCLGADAGGVLALIIWSLIMAVFIMKIFKM
jgi:hypothetical protein